MAGNLNLSSTTDDSSVVRSVVAAGVHKGEDGGLHVNDVFGGRAEDDIQYTQSDDGITSASYIDPAITEREQLEQQLADARQDLAQPAESGVADAPLQPAAAYNARLNELQQSNPEAIEALNNYSGPEPPTEVLELLATSPIGPDVAALLAQHPEVCERLSEIPVEQAVAETREYLSHQLGIAVGMQTAAQYHAQQNAQQQPRRRSNLGPTRAVGGSIKSSVEPENMSYSEYRKWHSNEVKAGRLRR